MPHGSSTDWHCLLKICQLISAEMAGELPLGKIGSVGGGVDIVAIVLCTCDVRHMVDAVVS